MDGERFGNHSSSGALAISWVLVPNGTKQYRVLVSKTTFSNLLGINV